MQCRYLACWHCQQEGAMSHQVSRTLQDFSPHSAMQVCGSFKKIAFLEQVLHVSHPSCFTMRSSSAGIIYSRQPPWIEMFWGEDFCDSFCDSVGEHPPTNWLRLLPWYVCRLLKASTFPIHLSVTYPIHYCQRNAHVESVVSKVNSLWAVDENAIVERLHPVSVTTLQL